MKIVIGLLVVALAANAQTVVAQEAAKADLVAVAHPTEGFTVNLPGDWEHMALGPSLSALSSQTHSMGGNSGTVMVMSTPAGRAFDRLVEQAEDGTANGEHSGVRNETRFFSHPQGQAVLVYQYVDRTDMKGAIYGYNIKIGETVWVVNCMATDSAEAIQAVVEVCEQVGPTFRAP